MSDRNKITIYDVAKKANVSRQTVSRVLNNRPDVAPATRSRVQEIIEELNYQPSAVARSLSRQKSFLFGVVTAGLKFIGPSRTLSGITSKAEEMGYGLLLKELASYTVENVEPIINWFKSHQVDGIIWAAPEIGDNRKWLDDLMSEIDIPIIFMTMENREEISIVALDNFEGARLATQHLIEVGKKNIGHITGPLDWWEARERKRGWEEALNHAGRSPLEHMWAEGNWSSKSGRRAFIELGEKYPEMDGVFVGNDQMALSVFQRAYEENILIPDQLAVVGFDDLPESAFYCPSLSSVRQDQDKLGRVAVQELARMVEKKNNPDLPIHIAIKTELIIRRSSVPVTNKGGATE